MLIGRDEMWAGVAREIGDRRSIVLSGCLGSGRTAVASMVAREFRGPLITASSATSAVSFGVVADRAVGTDLTARLGAVIDWLASFPVVSVDDAHLLDPHTAMALQVASRRVPIVATVLDGAPVDPAIGALCSSGITLALEPLGAGSTALFVQELLGEPLDVWSQLHVLEITGGLPAVVADMCRALSHVSMGGRRDLDALYDLVPTMVLVERVRSQLEPRVLAGLAVLGLAHSCSDHTFDRLFPGVRSDGRSLFRVDDGGVVRAASGHLAAAAVLALGPERLREVLAPIDATSFDPLGRIAVADLMGEPVAPADLTAAAVAAARSGRVTRSKQLLDRSGEITSGDQLVAVARVGSILGEAGVVGLAVAAADRVVLDVQQRAALAAIAAGVATMAPGADAVSVVAAIDRLDTDPAATRQLEVQRVAALFELGRFDEAIVRLRGLDVSGDRTIRMQAFIAEATVRMGKGDTIWVREQAVTHLAAGLAAGPEAVRPVVGMLLVALIFEFEFDEAQRVLQLGEATLGRSNPEQRAMMLAARAALELNRGRTRVAEQYVVDAVSVVRHAGLFDLLPLLGSLGVHASATGGHHEHLVEHLAMARLPTTAMAGVSTLLRPGVEASAAAALGDHKRAVALALIAAQDARRQGLVGAEVLQLSNAVRFGATTSLRAPRISKLRDTLASPVLRMIAGRVVATERADPHGLLEAGEFYAARGNPLEATECALQAGVAARQTGRESLAIECDLRAIEWERELDGVVSPLMELIRGGGGRFQLTRREREVVELARQGLSNRDIAETTSTSVRTVEGHLMRAYAKLGVAGRDDLRRGAGR